MVHSSGFFFPFFKYKGKNHDTKFISKEKLSRYLYLMVCQILNQEDNVGTVCVLKPWKDLSITQIEKKNVTFVLITINYFLKEHPRSFTIWPKSTSLSLLLARSLTLFWLFVSFFFSTVSLHSGTGSVSLPEHTQGIFDFEPLLTVHT